MTSHSSQIQLSEPGGANHRIMSFPIPVWACVHWPHRFPRPAMSCEQCRSSPDGLYTGMICDSCMQLIGTPIAPPGYKAESSTNHPEARWFPMAPQAVQTAASAMRSLDEKTMREPSSNSIGSWSWGGFLLGGVWALGNRLWIGYPILLLNALDHAISGHHLCVEVGLSHGLIQLSGQDLAASVRLFNLAIAVWLGYKGNALAWKRGNWESLAAFERVQRRWTLASIIVVVNCCGALFFLP